MAFPNDAHEFPAPNTAAPQLTVRALVTGMLLGALLTPCNVYTGLKIGWSFNMSITAALLSFAFWKVLENFAGTSRWGLLENNINQTTASSSASIISAGLVAPIPALTMLTGQQLPLAVLIVWVFSVSTIGIVVALGLRQQLLLRDRLPFPAGIATAETVREIYAKGKEALARVKVLLGAGSIAAALKLFDLFVMAVPKLAFPLALPAKGALKAAGIPHVSLYNLGLILDPSLLMVGFGAIIGIRAGLSLLLGAVLAWGIIGPWALYAGWARPGEPGPQAFWFGAMVEWLLWPGVTLMVMASLTSFAFSLRTAIKMAYDSRDTVHTRQAALASPQGKGFLIGLGLAAALAVFTQMAFFGIAFFTAVLAVLLTFLLAVVAGRVSGETGITPIGAMGKITQLTFGVATPGDATTNLMAANVTGGAAGQCADLLHDLKTGLLLGAVPHYQAIAQLFGVLIGSLVGSITYLALIPDPKALLITEEWPAPAVATWKAVAEVFQQGWSAIPPASLEAMVIAGLAGIALPSLARMLPSKLIFWLPSAPAMGLAFVIPAWNSISLFLGAAAGFLLMKVARSWAERFLLALAAGLVAGESLAGVAGAIASFLPLNI